MPEKSKKSECLTNISPSIQVGYMISRMEDIQCCNTSLLASNQEATSVDVPTLNETHTFQQFTGVQFNN